MIRDRWGVAGFLSVGVAVLSTGAYCVLAWFLGNLFMTLVGEIGAVDLPRLSRYLVYPLDADMEWNMLHWQFIAVASLAIALVFGRPVRRDGAVMSPMPVSIVTHYGVLLLLLFLHLIGFASAFTIVVPTID